LAASSDPSSILGADRQVPATLNPLVIAYNDYMRTTSGAYHSTRIELLHVATNFPRLKDLIATDSGMAITNARSNFDAADQQSQLAINYNGWLAKCGKSSPYHDTHHAIYWNFPKSYASPQAHIHPSHDTLEGLSKVKFHLSDRIPAINKHKEGNLLPIHNGYELWTDGSFYQGKLIRDDEGTRYEGQYGGAAALLIVWDNDGHQHDIIIQAKLGDTIGSSYGPEIISTAEGLDALHDYILEHKMNMIGIPIHIFSDSMSWMKQLQTLATRPGLSSQIVNRVASILGWLTDVGADVNIHFIPSHTESQGDIVTGIGHSIEIDNLAKDAATNPDVPLIEYEPRVQSYRAIYRKLEHAKLARLVNRSMTPSRFANYPPRQPFLDYFATRRKQDPLIHPLLLRACSGHNECRRHLHNVGITSDNICRHCEDAIETVEHQLLECPALPLTEEREIFHKLPNAPSYHEALWHRPDVMLKILSTAKKRGVSI
jgi:hypothetical protein